jgi:hypothetical protein
MLPLGHRSAQCELLRSGTLAGIKDRLEQVPIDLLSQGRLSNGTGDDIFMEVLVNNLKNECISYQAFMNKTIKNSIAQIIANLNTLKKNFSANAEEIFSIERKLDQIQDWKLRAKLENTRNFELINSEKITPNFLNLSKGSKSEACLSDLRDDSGREFSSEEEMKNYVRNFYAELYKSPDVDINFNENCIDDFLGEEICNSRLVKDSKVPPNLRQELESNLTLHKLDISANQGNKSACGMDGISNCFIKRYWDLLRIPLHRYSNICHSNGTLTQNFSSASIKLIPKKGDASKIKNWRPINLLSCLYKVISRALNNRLKKVSGFIFSRAQKGFTSDRHIQEVLLNVTEMIAHCKNNDIPGAILSIDQAKAFDTISHRYMHRVYEFFGFGPNFIKLSKP